MDEAASGGAVRTAACSCGALRVTVMGAPARVNACSCHQCQKRSGSAFTYSAFFSDAAVVSIEGERKSWRTFADSGRFQDWSFCPLCGTTVFSRLEAMPGFLCVAVGCFTDPEFEGPPKFYWSSRKHHWLTLPEAIEALETQ